MGTGRSVTLTPERWQPLRPLAQPEPGGGEGSAAGAAGRLSCAAGEGERLSAGGKESGKGSYSGGRMKDTRQAYRRASTPLKMVLETRAWCAGAMRSAPTSPRGLMESCLVALPWKVACVHLCSVGWL